MTNDLLIDLSCFKQPHEGIYRVDIEVHQESDNKTLVHDIGFVKRSPDNSIVIENNLSDQKRYYFPDDFNNSDSFIDKATTIYDVFGFNLNKDIMDCLEILEGKDDVKDYRITHRVEIFTSVGNNFN